MEVERKRKRTDEVRERERQYYWDHRAEILASRKKCNHENADKLRQIRAKSYQRNKEKVKEYQKQSPHRWYELGRSAARRNMVVEFTKEEYEQFFYEKPCVYCNEPAYGVDRVENSIRAYILTNSVPCCGQCNLMKGSYSVESFIDKSKKIAQKWSSNNIRDDMLAALVTQNSDGPTKL